MMVRTNYTPLLRLASSVIAPRSIPPPIFLKPTSTTALTLILHRRHRRRWLSVSAITPPLPTFDDHYFSPAAEADDESGNLQKKMLLKGMTYTELEKWVKSHGYRPGQALMLWKRLYGNNIWAHSSEELEGLNKNFKNMLGERAEFKVVHLKEILTASDGTRKEVTDFVHIGRWTGY